MGGGSESTQLSGTQDIQAPEYAALRPFLASTLGQFMGASPQQIQEQANAYAEAQGIDPFTVPQTDIWGGTMFQNIPGAEELSPEMTEAEAQQLAALQSMATTRSESQEARDALLMDAMSDDYVSPTHPFLGAAIEAANRPIQEQLARDQLENAAMFNLTGQVLPLSSPFAAQRNLTSSQAQQLMADTSARMALPWAEGQAQRQLEAAEEMRLVQQFDMDSALANLEAQALPRLIEQYGIEEGSRIMNQRLAMLMQLAGIAMGGTQVVPGSWSVGESESTRVL